jgi:parvulin-like peptidyl-prolyl isomerase
MLEQMRKLTNSTGILLLFGLIIFTFIFFFGPQTAGISVTTRTRVGEVGNVEVWKSVLDARVSRSRAMSGERGNLDDAEYMRRSRQILDDYLLLHWIAGRAQDGGLRVSDEEVRCYIVNWNRRYAVNGELICEQFPEDIADRYPNYEWGFYSRDGVLSETYRADIQSQFSMSIDEFESYKRNELLARRYLDLLQQSIPVGASLVSQATARRTESVDLEYIRLSASRTAADPVTQIEIDQLIAAESGAVEAYYAANAADFQVEEQVQLRRTFLRRPADDAPDAAEARSTYESVLARAVAGEDFEALAREFSQLESERTAGGDMGNRTRSTLAAVLWDAAAALEPNGVTGVEQASNFSIIQLVSETPAGQQPLDDVRESIARTILEERATAAVEETLRARGQTIIELATSGNLTLAQAARQEAESRNVPSTEGSADEGSAAAPESEGSGESAADADPPGMLPALTTGAFSRARAPESLAALGPQFASMRLPAPMPDNIPGIGDSREVATLAFNLAADSPVHSEIVRVGEDLFILRLNERTEPSADDTAVSNAVFDEFHADLVSEFFGRDVVGTATDARLFRMQTSGDLPPILQAMMDEASPRFTVRESEFVVDPVDELPVE